MFRERSFWNLFRDSRTPLNLTRNKLVTLIYFALTSVCTRHLATSLDLPSNTVRLSTVGSRVPSFHQTIAITKLDPVTSSRPQRLMQLGAPRPFAIKTTQQRHKLY